MSEPMNTLRMIGSTITDRAEKLAQIDTEEAHIRLDELRAGRLKVAEHPQLDAAAQHALTRPLAGAEALERRKPVVDTSPLFAAELAVWRALEVKPPTVDPFVIYA